MPVQTCLESEQKQLFEEIEEDVLGCIHCGLCQAFCQSFRALGSEASSPRGRVHLIRAASEGRVDLGNQGFEHFWLCTLCNRCELACPIGLKMADLVRKVRNIYGDRLPEGLRATVAAHLDTGNNMSVTKEDYLDTLEWMEEELQAELDDPTFRIPLDVKGARYLHTFNPKEPRFYPLLIQYAANIYRAAGESWTVSSEAWDVTNYALYDGNDERATEIARRLFDRARELGVEAVVASECGHGYYAMRWGAEKWLGKENVLPVRSVVEVMADYITSGRIQVDPSVHAGALHTYHDPCHLGRKGGIFDEPRQIIQACVPNFVELADNRESSWCCGGGGGALAMTELTPKRRLTAEMKAEQIRQSGAEIVITACHNCHDQLEDIKKVYGLTYKLKNLSEIVSKALVQPSAETA
ncbi:MAG: hypothetical protein COZ06_15325 [Armatimonadetes bacterium CG_4_10_14_3_um_filter_66_18]|nr:(Fe-S)-binding protein [Armatimonadota bacterium]OIP12641.1 MAG: hypothetical protein AUJ96_00250 [Armatimonadetes bacterium CG2_30_66_41]PIU88988.1 MAG: hypothetical protein COS65_29375 [Armatimonadetes bacterium CG06_land_8_20_14_3_00_66_21]PIX37837.1 MAG: hypothetical protein COZ57_32225 [Armatimonadetes bacterium CG_4_8_14_3_um_filter_66_20]PIY48910.1 MAG: hypothetical protein COZ06_15325 [Armatimonadetes bacterium CG_4_10_14_3_um_filter_66_18]PIZ33987.1 MAG: hypothetical protein COY42_